MACSACCSVYAKCVIAFLSILIILCIFGALRGPEKVNEYVAKEISAAIDEMMVLSPSSRLFDKWMNGKVPVYQRFYFFDIQNADDIARGAKLNVTEVGPYTYRLRAKRSNVTFGDNDTLSYDVVTWLEFVPEMSAGLENDTITTANIPLATVCSKMKYRDWFERLTVSAVANIHSHGMFRTLTIGELLWGYEDPVLKQLQDLAGKETIKDYVVGILKGKNGTKGHLVINTGVSDRLKLNHIIEWNGGMNLSCWDNDEANRIYGSDGTILHPGIRRDEIINVFNPSNRRTIHYRYQNDTDLYGLPMLKFSVPSYEYANATSYPPNRIFCTQGECLDGIVNVSTCLASLPVGLSLPHYLYAPSYLADAIDGIQPNEARHQSYFVVEPVMGITFVQRRRLQLNVYIEYVDGIVQTYEIPNMYYPLLWMETTANVPEVVATELKNSLSQADGYDDIVFYFFIGVAGVCFILICLIFVCLCTCCKKSSPEIRKQNGGSYEVVANSKQRNVSNGKVSSGNIYMAIEDNDNKENQTKDESCSPNGDINKNTNYTVLSNESDEKEVWLKQDRGDSAYSSNSETDIRRESPV